MSTTPNDKTGVIVGSNIFGGGIEVPAESVDKDLWNLALRYQFLYSLAGLIAGLACVLCGIFLFWNGIDGVGSSWTADAFGLKISDAAPGVVLFFVGLALAQLTKFTVRIAPRRQDEKPK